MAFWLEPQTQRHRHLPRVERRCVTAQTAVGLHQYAVLPVVRGTDVPATELRVVKDVIHLRPEQQHALLVLQREVLGERHVPVVRARTRNGYDTAGSGVPEALHRFSY